MERRIGKILGPVGVGEFFGFDEEVKIIGAVPSHRPNVVTFQDVQDLERGNSLAVGRKLPHIVAAVVGRDGFDPFGPVVLEVLHAEVTAERFAGGDDLSGDGAAVVGIASPFGDCAEAGGQVRIAEELADARRLAARIVRGQELGLQAGFSLAASPSAADDLADGKSLFGVLDRGGQQLLEAHRSKPLAQLVPAVDAAGDRPGENPFAGNVFQSFLLEDFSRERVGAAAAAVEAVQFLRFRVPIADKDVAAHAVAHWLDQPEHGVGGDRGVGGVPARLEDFETNLRSQRLAGGDDAVRGQDGGAALVRQLRWAVVLAGECPSRGKLVKPCRVHCHECEKNCRNTRSQSSMRSHRRFSGESSAGRMS